MVAEPYENEGIVQKLITLLEKELPECHFVPVLANVSRITETFKAGKPGIYGTFRKTPEREVFTLYSEPYLLYQAAGIMVHDHGRGVWSHYLQDGTLDLSKALRSENFRLCVISNVNLGSWIDDPVQLASERNLLWVTLSAENAQDPRMSLLSMNRVTGVTGYEASLRMDIQKAGLPLDEFYFYPVMGAPAFQKMSLATGKSEEGQRLLARLNPVLIRLRPLLAREYERWISQNSIIQYRQLKF